MSGIVWLASYPKSGNTWFRVFLANYLREADRPADINRLDDDPISSGRQMFDEALGYDSGEMGFDEIDALRPEVYLHMARRANETLYCKAHDAFTLLPDGRPLFPFEATESVLYVARNPLDVAVSYAHHNGITDIDKTIRHMGDPAHCLCGSRQREYNQLRQRLLSWSGHFLSWAGAARMRVKVVRYEDMLAQPEQVFGAAVRFLGLPYAAARLRKAIHFSRFDELREQEATAGFHEKAPTAPYFFRKGEAGAWRSALTAEQIAAIIGDHGEAMQRLGYLDSAGRLCC